MDNRKITKEYKNKNDSVLIYNDNTIFVNGSTNKYEVST